MNIVTPADLIRVLDRLATEDRLTCVADGETMNNGKPVRPCSSFISHPEQMCAGCAAKHLLYAAGADARPTRKDPEAGSSRA